MSQQDELDDILSQTLEEFSLEENRNTENIPTAPNQDNNNCTSSLEQVLKLLSEEVEESGEDAEQWLQGIVSQLSLVSEQVGEEREDRSNTLEQTSELENMMQVVVRQLLSKEILQEPMEQLYQRYCTWLEENTTSSEDYDRFVQQKQLVYQICEEYRGEGGGDTDKVLQLLQQMQNLGSPPPNVISQEDDNHEPIDSQWRDLQNQCQTQ